MKGEQRKMKDEVGDAQSRGKIYSIYVYGYNDDSITTIAVKFCIIVNLNIRGEATSTCSMIATSSITSTSTSAGHTKSRLR